MSSHEFGLHCTVPLPFSLVIFGIPGWQLLDRYWPGERGGGGWGYFRKFWIGVCREGS